MIFQNEYQNKNRVAHLFKRQEEQDFIVMCYIQAEESLSEPFELESQAEEFIQAFLRGEHDNLQELQPVSDSTSCCD
jgi:hypothetical protein